MSEIKPVSSNEHVSIKTANQEMSEWIRSGKTSTMSHGELYAFFERQEAKKLRAALEALQAENAAQAKRITWLERELTEWNEFKKIRDSQMAQLRKQFG